MVAAAMQDKKSYQTFVWIVVCLAFIVSLYWIARYGVYFTENDTAKMNNYITSTTTNQHIVSQTSSNYPSGFGYPASMSMVSLLTGLDGETVNRWISLWLPPIILIVFVTYRTLTSNGTISAIACFLLLLMPDVLFYLLRGAHEKFTWSFVLIMLFLVARSASRSTQTRQSFQYIILFYIHFFALITTHIFFSTTILVCVLVGSVILLLYTRIAKSEQLLAIASMIRRRFFIIALNSLIIVYMTMFYFYPPTSRYFSDLRHISRQLTVFFVSDVEDEEVPAAATAEDTPAAAEPTTQAAAAPQASPTRGTPATIARDWRSIGYYLATTIIQWGIAAVAAIYLVITILRILFRRYRPRFGMLLLYIFFLAATIQVTAGVLFDVSQAGFYSNIKSRLFVFFGMLAACIMAVAITQVVQALRRTKLPIVKFAFYGASGVALLIAMAGPMLSLIKMTNDPLIANNWLFYSPQERSAVTWLENQESPSHYVGWGFKVNQREAIRNWFPIGYSVKNIYLTLFRPIKADYILLSNLVLYNATQLRIALPRNITQFNFNTVYTTNGVSILSDRYLGQN